MQFNTPFSKSIKSMFEEKYSPLKGFGALSAVKNDKHTEVMNKRIDEAIEDVAYGVSKKEDMIMNKKNLRCNIAFIFKDIDKLKKEEALINEKIAK
jgi:hypothetical protein